MTLQNIKISLRSDSLENWISSDPVLKNGELVMVNDISAGLVRFKIGNGVSAFVQLPYVNEKKVITDFAKVKRTESQYFSQGVNNFASPLGFAAGSYLTADSSFAQVLGINACALEGHDYSFVWNGDGSGTIGVQSYRSHGEGTFNVNPVDGVNGIYIGNQTLSGILSSTCQPKGNYLSSNALDNYKTYDDTKLSLSGDGYATQAQLNEKSAVSVDNVKADVNMVHISLDDYNEKLVGGEILSNELYVISSDYVETFGQQIKNVAAPTDLSDAATKEYVDNAVQGVQIPTDLSAFTNSPGYLISNDISGYYKKSETSSATQLSDAFSAKADISSSLILVEWADLTALADAEEFVPGQKYRITDYVTTVDQEDCRSAEHPFDLIVTAIDHNTLDEHAVATLPSNGDDYFDAREFHVQEYQQYLEYARVPLESWDIKYCLDNDKTRFKFADTENGKGVIYYMKDEFGNEAPYDFKNVQFKRYKITYSPRATSLEGMYGLAVGSIEVDTSDEMWCYTFNGADYEDFGLSEPYDFSGWHIRPTQAVLEQFGGPSIERLQECFGNTILERQEDADDYSLMSFKLPNNVFHCVLDQMPVSQLPFIKIGLCSANKLGSVCHSNTFGNSCTNNTFGNYCDSNTFGNSCASNTFGNYCDSNTFGNSCASNTFGNYCDSNTFGNSCASNTFGNYCDRSVFGDSCCNNIFGNGCDSNIFGNSCANNTFGNSCANNTFGNCCSYNIFGNSCYYIKFASTATSDPSQAKSYYRCITVDSDNQYIILNCTQSTYGGHEYKNVRILPGVNNTTSYKTITDSNVNQSFCTTYQSAGSQLMLITI